MYLYMYIYMSHMHAKSLTFSSSRTVLLHVFAHMWAPGCKVLPQEPMHPLQKAPQACCTSEGYTMPCLDLTKRNLTVPLFFCHTAAVKRFCPPILSGDSVWYRSTIHTRCSHLPRCPEFLSPFQPGQLQGWLSKTLLGNPQPWASNCPNVESGNSEGCAASDWAPHEEDCLSTERLHHP